MMTTQAPARGALPPPDAFGEWDEQRLRQREKNQPLIDRLRSRREETDPDVFRDQKETWEFLKWALDEDRLFPDRKLFP